jgi:hypothetical protein
MEKKKIISYSLLVVLLLGSITYGIANNRYSIEELTVEVSKKLGNLVAKYDVNEEKGDTVAIANGIEIYEKDVEKFRQINDFFNMHVSEEEILQQTIRNKLLLKEAEKRNIKIDLAQAKEYAKLERESLEKDPEQKEIRQAYIKGLGLTEDEYWDEYTVEEVHRMLTVAELYKEIVNEKTTDDITEAERNKIIAEYEQKLLENVNLEILD